MNRKTLTPLLLLLCLLSFVSCKTSKRQVMSVPLKEQGADYLFGQMKKNEFKFNRISLKFSAEVESNNQNSSFSGNVYLVKDSMMWISIQKFGLEAVRVLITPDSAKMINRINKTFFISTFSKVNELFNTDFDFDILQSIISGNDFEYYQNDVFKATIENKLYRLSTIGRQKLKKYVQADTNYSMVLIQDLWLDPQTFKILNTQLKEIKTQDKRKIMCDYSDFLQIDKQMFPQKLDFTIMDEKKLHGAITFTRISPDKTESFPFNIPKTYTESNKIKN